MGKPTDTASAPSGYFIGVAALLVSIVALGLAVIPLILLPSAEEVAEVPQAERPAPEEDGGVTLEFKDISITFGGKSEDDDEADEAPPPEPQPPVADARARQLRLFSTAAAPSVP